MTEQIKKLVATIEELRNIVRKHEENAVYTEFGAMVLREENFKLKDGQYKWITKNKETMLQKACETMQKNREALLKRKNFFKGCRVILKSAMFDLSHSGKIIAISPRCKDIYADHNRTVSQSNLESVTVQFDCETLGSQTLDVAGMAMMKKE